MSFQENVAIVVFGAKTQVLHRLSTDYFNIRRSIGMHSNLFSETSCPALSIIVIYIWIVSSARYYISSHGTATSVTTVPQPFLRLLSLPPPPPTPTITQCLFYCHCYCNYHHYYHYYCICQFRHLYRYRQSHSHCPHHFHSYYFYHRL